MDISPAALAILKKLFRRLPASTGGLRFEGYIGTCHGSSPVFKPVAAAAVGDLECPEGGLRFFVPPDNMELFAGATLDVDRAFMGRGLFLTWPQCPGCDCAKSNVEN